VRARHLYAKRRQRRFALEFVQGNGGAVRRPTLRKSQLHAAAAAPGLTDRAREVERLERFALPLQRSDGGGKAFLARAGRQRFR
jgi:hypothetical protein